MFALHTVMSNLCQQSGLNNLQFYVTSFWTQKDRISHITGVAFFLRVYFQPHEKWLKLICTSLKISLYTIDIYIVLVLHVLRGSVSNNHLMVTDLPKENRPIFVWYRLRVYHEAKFQCNSVLHVLQATKVEVIYMNRPCNAC